MSNNINLITKRRVLTYRSLTKQERQFRFVSIVILFLVLFVTAAVFVMKLTSPLSALQEEEKRQRDELTRLYPTTAKLLFLKNRTQELAKIIKARPDLVKIINLVQKEKPEEVTLNSLKVTSSQITFDASATSLAAVDTYLNVITDLGIKQKILQSAMLGGLTLNTQDNSYTFALDILL